LTDSAALPKPENGALAAAGAAVADVDAGAVLAGAVDVVVGAAGFAPNKDVGAGAALAGVDEDEDAPKEKAAGLLCVVPDACTDEVVSADFALAPKLKPPSAFVAPPGAAAGVVVPLAGLLAAGVPKEKVLAVAGAAAAGLAALAVDGV
jgi:hypothetical protein